MGLDRLGSFGAITIFDWTPSMNTGGNDAGDVAAATEELTDIMRRSGGSAILVSMMVVDDDDVGGDLDIVLMDSNVALGTEDAAPSITDANADNVLGIIPAGTYDDLGGVKYATNNQINMIVKSLSGSKHLYAGIIDNTGSTYTAAGITIRFGLMHS